MKNTVLAVGKYTTTDFNRAKRHKEQTKNGVFFEWGLAGQSGAWFVLFREEKHTDEDMLVAERQIRNDRDVVWIRVSIPEADADQVV